MRAERLLLRFASDDGIMPTALPASPAGHCQDLWMSFRFRDARYDDLDAIADLNDTAGISVAPLERERLDELYRTACYFRVAFTDDTLAGFLIGTDRGASHGNAGFRWFRERHARFVYIDRIVVAGPFRGHGLGRILYADLLSYAEVRVPVLGCQVSLQPRDDASVLFHASLGFHEVTQLTTSDGVRIGVMERSLCSYAYVRDRYLLEDGHSLPHLPWLAARERPSPAAMACGGGE